MSSFLREIPVVFSFIDTVQSFIRTRQAVMRGENLHLLSDTQLRQQEFMRPWSFNVTESILVSLPFTTSISFIDFLLQSSDGDLYAKIYSYVWPTSLPFLLLLIGLISGRMGLIKEDRTRSKVRLSTRAYLYIEGAYGFLPEMLMVLVVGYASLFGGISVIPYLALFIWITYITLLQVPKKLFVANGYALDANGNAPDPPMGKYQFTKMYVIPAMIILWGFAVHVLCTLMEALVLHVGTSLA